MDDNTQGNWGLTTEPRDNPYDGRSAERALTVNAWDYPVGGEAADYGNFLDGVTQANSLWLNLIPRKQTSGAIGGITR